MSGNEERIRERAYQIWESEGCPTGRAEDHWHQAREIVALEHDHPSTLKTVEPADGSTASRVEARSRSGQ